MLLNELVSTALGEAGEEIDFEQIADKVVASLPQDEVDQVVRYLVRHYVVNFAGRRRRDLLSPGMAELTDAVADADSPEPGPSRRQSYVHIWRRVLDAVVVIEEGKPGKRLGACSVSDVLQLESNLARREAEIHARRLQYRFLAEAMNAAKAKKVEDLPPAVIEAFAKGGKS